MGAQHRGRWDLLRLARSSAAGQGVLVLLDGLDTLHRLESLKHGVAVQVIDLVLQAHAEQVARSLVANQVCVQVVRLDDDMVGTLDLAANAIFLLFFPFFCLFLFWDFIFGEIIKS